MSKQHKERARWYGKNDSSSFNIIIVSASRLANNAEDVERFTAVPLLLCQTALCCLFYSPLSSSGGEIKLAWFGLVWLAHNPNVLVVTGTWLHPNIIGSELCPPPHSVTGNSGTPGGGGIGHFLQNLLFWLCSVVLGMEKYLCIYACYTDSQILLQV